MPGEGPQSSRVQLLLVLAINILAATSKLPCLLAWTDALIDIKIMSQQSILKLVFPLDRVGPL